jgi:rhamnulokinase
MMTESFNCIAVDMGASSIRIMLGSISKGILSYQEKHRFKNEIIEHDGFERWDIEKITNEISLGIKKIIENSTELISSIGVDSWGVDFVLLDEKGNLLDLPVAYRDKRTNGMIEKWSKEMSRKETFQKTGINFYDFNTLFHLLSIRDTKMIKKVRTILFMPCYINYSLCGEKYNEVTIASTSQLLNVAGNKINAEIIQKLNLEPEVFNEIVPSGKKIGKLKSFKSTESEINIISVCGHDTACAVTAIPAKKEDFAFIATGTWCIVGTVSKEAVTSEFALNEGFTNERGYNNSYRLLKNINGLWLVQGLKSAFDDKFSYSEIEDLARKSESTQLVFPENEMFYNPKNMKTAFDQFFKLSGQNIPKSPGDYFKCAYDSLCFSFRLNIEKLEIMLNKNYDSIHLIGGGCQSRYLSEQTSNICKRKVISGPVEGATIGNILIQGLSAGIICDIDEAHKIVTDSFEINEYLPDDNSAKNDNIYLKFKQLKH